MGQGQGREILDPLPRSVNPNNNWPKGAEALGPRGFMDHSQIQPTPGGDWKTSPHSHFAARLVEKPLEEEFHSPISARSGRIPDRAHTALDTTFSQPPPPAATDQVKCEVVTRAARTAVSPQSGSPKIARELSLMDTAKPRTIFITGATGLVGGHAAEEALRRGHRVRALCPRQQRHPLARPVGGREGPGRPGGRRIAAAGSRRGRLGLQLCGQGGRLGHARRIPPPQRRCPPATPRRGLRRSSRAIRARQLAGRLRGSRPSRHRRDRPAGGQLA